MGLNTVLDEIDAQICRGEWGAATARLTGQILTQEPGNPRALCLLARIAAKAGEVDLARHLYSDALAVDAVNPDVLAGLAECDVANGDFAAAEMCLRLALQFAPERVDLLGNLGAAMLSAGRLQSAADTLEQTLALSPTDPVARLNRGLLRLLDGDFIGGFSDYEARLILRPRELAASWVDAPLWDGGALPGGVLLVRAEQGMGDTLQFSRLLPLAAERVGHIIFEVQPEVIPVLPDMANVDIRPWGGGGVEAFDVWCPLLSLPHRLRLTLDALPGPCLRVPDERRADWGRRLGNLSGRRIGLVWAGSATHDNDRRRSISEKILEVALAPIAAMGEVSFVGLQKGRPLPGGVLALDVGDSLGDFGDTAAVLEQLDMLVSVDTSVAHLAGGLGVPVWALLPEVPDWRWMLNRSNSPWYPSMRLLRQRPGEGWPELLGRLAVELAGIGSVKKL